MRRSTVMAALFVALSPPSASANGHAASGTAQAVFIADGEPTLAPMAFLKFCLKYQSQCATPSEETPIVIELTPNNLAEMRSVNAAVNARIAPNPAKDGDHWSLETRYGNCNDYAVQKRDELARRGFPISALSLATVMTRDGQGHLVLTVRTNRGDYVLDNLNAAIMPWNTVRYAWLKRQSAAKPRYWVDLSGSSPAHRAQTASSRPQPAHRNRIASAGAPL